MTRDEIYEHLARVYLGKQKKTIRRKKKELNLRLIGRVFAALLVLTCVFYGLSAFLVRKNGILRNNVIYSLNQRPIRIKYDLRDPFPQIHSFSIPIPKINAEKYDHISFMIRSLDSGKAGIIKIVVTNRKHESSSYFVKGVQSKWQQIEIPLEEFKSITDWSNVTDVSFVLEAWNIQRPKGVVLIDDLCFASKI